jgi:hypothetical protein
MSDVAVFAPEGIAFELQHLADQVASAIKAPRPLTDVEVQTHLAALPDSRVTELLPDSVLERIGEDALRNADAGDLIETLSQYELHAMVVELGQRGEIPAPEGLEDIVARLERFGRVELEDALDEIANIIGDLNDIIRG